MTIGRRNVVSWLRVRKCRRKTKTLTERIQCHSGAQQYLLKRILILIYVYTYAFVLTTSCNK